MAERHHKEDAMEAARNLVEGEEHEHAATLSAQICEWLERAGHSVALAAFAGEILSDIPLTSQAARGLAQAEADANERLGLIRAAEARWRQVIAIESALAEAEPDRADYQRDLSISYNKLGDLMIAVGRGEEAARLYQQSLDITRRLAEAEPDRADYQRDLSISCQRMSRELARQGQRDRAVDLLAQAIKLANAALDRAPGNAEATVDVAYLLSEEAALLRDADSARSEDSQRHAIDLLRGLADDQRLPARGRQILERLAATAVDAPDA